MEAGADHWDGVYGSKSADEVSWYQPDAGVSLDLIAKHGGRGALIDVGAGASVLVDHLLRAGRDDVSLLDVSSEGLEETRERLGPDAAAAVTYIVADMLDWTPDRSYAVWHDRAVFHFLVDPGEQAAYVRAAALGVDAGGIVVLGTFAEDGPQQCSGLPTARYDAQTLAAHFAEDFVVIDQLRNVHRTPWGSEQPFTWVVLRRESVLAD